MSRAPAGDTTLDLSSSPAVEPPAAASDTTLDLSSAGAAKFPAGAARARPDPSSRGVTQEAATSPRPKIAPSYVVRRAQAGRPEVLTPKAPTVTLNRIQSGVGALRIEAACSDAVGDLRLGCAYRLRNGLTSLVQHESGLTTAPLGSTRPVLLGERDRFETVTVDLAQVRELDRLLVYGFSAGTGHLDWGGTLIVTTFGGARIEVPMDGRKSSGVVGLATIYNDQGELVVRAEPREVHASVRETCLAFGFDRITWLDSRTPVT